MQIVYVALGDWEADQETDVEARDCQLVGREANSRLVWAAEQDTSARLTSDHVKTIRTRTDTVPHTQTTCTHG